MKKDKKMMAMYHRVNAIMTKSDELSRKLSLKIVAPCSKCERHGCLFILIPSRL